MDEEIKLEEPILSPEDDFKDKYFRQLADMENMRKRMGKEKQEMIRFGIENAIADFLPVVDQFEQALRFANAASPEVKNWAMGFQMILSQFQGVLQNHSISAYSSEGTLFDPSLHEAVEAVDAPGVPEGTIIQEFTKGYKSPTRVIRPARVKVAKINNLEPEENYDESKT